MFRQRYGNEMKERIFYIKSTPNNSPILHFTLKVRQTTAYFYILTLLKNNPILIGGREWGLFYIKKFNPISFWYAVEKLDAKSPFLWKEFRLG
jgi:hypothetical protein